MTPPPGWASFSSSIAHAWEVFLLFLIPIGGGIPAGVVVAQSRQIQWPEMSILYLISDIVLAFIFEPLMFLFIAAGKRSTFLSRLGQAFQKSMKKTTAQYGNNLRPVSLILIAFGVDPMTGRVVAKAAGHRFVSGWALAITGDMFYFWLIMASTIWLNNILGDGTKTTLIILVVMMFGPALIRRIREGKKIPNGSVTAK